MRRTVTLFLSLLLLAVAVSAAHAHTSTEIGSYIIIAGWELEPAIVGERNTIFIEVWEDEGEVEYQDMRLNAAFIHGDQRKPIRLIQGSDKGRYIITFIPTVAGEFRVHLFGTIGDESIDIEVAPESVGEATIIQFPDSVLSTGQLQDGLIGLEEQLSTLRTMATVGIAAGVGGIALAGYTAMRGRSKPDS